MNDLPLNLRELGGDLHTAVAARLTSGQRRRRRVRVAAAAVALAGVFSAAAVASGIAPNLELDPTKWTILERGTVDDGRGEYVRARNKQDGSVSVVLHERDAGLEPYEAFLLHERTSSAAGSPRAEHGPLCTAAELTRAEVAALAALRARHEAGTPPGTMRATADAAIAAAFAGETCRGLEYAGERARFVYAGIEPRSLLMPGAR